MADGVATSRPDTLAAEEPLEIRVAGRPLTVTMRTPGDDFDLARGFLVSEGVVSADSDIVAIRYCAGATANGVNTYNVLDVLLDDGVPAPDPSLERNFYTSSSCGLCGKASLEAVRTISKWHVDRDPLRLNAATIATLPDKLRAAQRVFDRTGGLHAAGLFDAGGELLCVREDVGRHNAVDKVIGWALELVQKAVMAGVPALAAVSAPSSLAVDLAREMGLTLIGFLRGSSMNIYSGVERIPSGQDEVAYTGERQAI
jgi:FdhD protein